MRASLHPSSVGVRCTNQACCGEMLWHRLLDAIVELPKLRNSETHADAAPLRNGLARPAMRCRCRDHFPIAEACPAVQPSQRAPPGLQSRGAGQLTHSAAVGVAARRRQRQHSSGSLHRRRPAATGPRANGGCAAQPLQCILFCLGCRILPVSSSGRSQWETPVKTAANMIVHRCTAPACGFHLACVVLLQFNLGPLR